MYVSMVGGRTLGRSFDTVRPFLTSPTPVTPMPMPIPATRGGSATRAASGVALGCCATAIPGITGMTGDVMIFCLNAFRCVRKRYVQSGHETKDKQEASRVGDRPQNDWGTDIGRENQRSSTVTAVFPL